MADDSPPSALAYLVYDLTVWFFCQTISIFFRDIGERNAHSIPTEGPVFFVAAPHHNQFVDPIVLLRHCRRRVYLLTAASSMKRRFVGAFARAIRSIPVARAQDCAVAGTGRVRLVDRYHAPTRLLGVGTQFTSQLHPGDSVAIPDASGSSEVVRVMSDTELEVRREFKDLRALEALTQPDGTPFKIYPHLDQSGVYDAVHRRLNQGDCIGIFPEGGSHDRAQMLPLKAGVAVMTLGAMAENSDLNVRIVPCGLNYFHPHKFRSRAIVQFGDPISIPPALVAQFKRGGTEKREACSKLLGVISEALQSVTINTPDYETLQLIQAGRRLYRPDGRKLSMGQVVELTRRFVKGYMIFKDHPAVVELRERIAEYNQDLKYYGLRDHQVGRMVLNRADALVLMAWRLVCLGVMATLALPGVVLNGPVFVAAKLISKRKAREALAKSTVKIEGRDVLATWKILVCLVFFPTLYLTYAACAVYWRVTRPAWFTSSSLAVLRAVGAGPPVYAALLTLISLPVLSFACLWFGESGLDIYRSIRPLFLVQLLGADSARQLARRREALSDDVTDLINELAPKIYPDFDEAHTLSEFAGGKRRRRPVRGPLGEPVAAEGPDGEDTTGGSRFSFPALTPTTMSRLNWVSPLEFLGTYSSQRPATPGEFTRSVGDFFGVSDWRWDKSEGESRPASDAESSRHLSRQSSHTSLYGKKASFAGHPGTTGGLSALTQLHPASAEGSDAEAAVSDETE
ncbi:Glycerol-3-phosphate/dihydroxyacetone phosphate acyltransferase [Tieghemiomyces parasiticus]|uniref:Glycerol-3-phosphate/dihydroxyacetone phosphate acyltransferase n=1 Tax=Tieghemiomyces parasiticus TaxID=78921 RepID=A0A9W7ZSF7_9FUNG|nr:Glycerol-3-phosphate/dihydroxyacetone phosphate acyltransferase [Tieghemiomyces parasiticus]